MFALFAAATSTKSSPLTLYLMLGIGLIAYFAYFRPRSQKMKQQREAARAYELHDEVQTIGGIIGTVDAIDGDEVTLRTAGSTVLTMHKRAIAGRHHPAPPEVPGPVEPTADDANGAGESQA